MLHLSTPSWRRTVLPLLFAWFTAFAAHAAPAPGLAIVVKPLMTNGVVSALEVRQTLTGGLPAVDTPLRLHAPLALFGLPSLADRIVDLSVLDAHGPVPLTIENDAAPEGYAVAYRHWVAARKTVAPVSVRYRIAAQPPSEGRGPPFGMRPGGQGVSGRGIGFLLLPENTTTQASAFSWDLSELPAGSIGVITAGAGPTVVPGPPSEVATQWMMAGPMRVYRSARSPGFEAYQLGKAPFDVDDALAWAEQGYAYLSSSLKYLGMPTYRLFFRSLDVPAYATGSARDTGGGALMTTGNTLGSQSAMDFKSTIFHEMTHQWVGDPSGIGMWFVEGLTVYLTAVMPCEAGMADAQFCANAVNKYTELYYGSVARNWSLERITAAGTGQEDVRLVPYGRGLVYFGLLNTQLLAKSNGRRALPDVLAPLFADRAKGGRLDEQAWEAMLLRELGQPAVDEFRASVIDGAKTIVPPPDAFGPCLRRVRVDLPAPGGSGKVDGYAWQPQACARQAPAVH